MGTALLDTVIVEQRIAQLRRAVLRLLLAEVEFPFRQLLLEANELLDQLERDQGRRKAIGWRLSDLVRQAWSADPCEEFHGTIEWLERRVVTLRDS